MTNKTDTPMLNLGIVAPVKVQKQGFFSSARSFRCPPGFIYSIFRKTSAGPEFIESYSPNETGKLGKEDELYRVSIGGASERYVYREVYTFTDDTTIELETELFVKVIDGAGVTRLTIQDHLDPLKRLRDDVRWLLENNFAQYDYDKIFFPKTKQIKLNIRNYGEEIKQKAKTGDYGLEITEVRIRYILPPELKKRWEADLLAWQGLADKEIEREKLANQRREAELKKEIAQLGVDEAKLDAELDQKLTQIKHKQEDSQTERTRAKEDEARQREHKIQQEKETARQDEIRLETEGQIGLRQTEQEADITARQRDQEAHQTERQTETDFEQGRELTEVRHQIRVDQERKAEEQRKQIESLRHQANTGSLVAQIEQARRKEEDRDKVHQLRLQRMEELAQIRIEDVTIEQIRRRERLQTEQTRQITAGDQDIDLKHKYKLLEFKEKEIEQEIKFEQRRQENKLAKEEQLALLELKKELIRTRLAIMDRIAAGESDLTTDQMNQLLGIDSLMNEPQVTQNQIATFVESLKEYLTEGGAEKVREAIDQLIAPNQPHLLETTAEVKEKNNESPPQDND